MKKIAILRCLKSNDVCTGAFCLKAFNRKSGKFAEYGGEDLELVAFMTCNGCGTVNLHNEAGLREKLEMIKMISPDVLHVGVCTKQKTGRGKYAVCPHIETILCEIRKLNIKIVDGTH